MNRPLVRGAALAGLLLAPIPAFAADGIPSAPPPGTAQEGPAGPGPQESIEEISRRISRALKENEEALSRLARGENGDPRKVDIELPKEGPETVPVKSPAEGSSTSPRGGGESGAGAGAEAAEGLRRLLEGSSRQGRSIVSGMEEILRKAANQARQGTSGGDEGSRPKGATEGGGDEPRNAKKDPEGKKDPLEDNTGKEPEKGPPEDGRKSKKKPEDADPPRSEKRPPSEPDLKGVFLAKLPDKVREAVKNGDFDKVPEKYRSLIAEWTLLLGKEEK